MASTSLSPSPDRRRGISLGLALEAPSQEHFDLIVRGGTLTDGTATEPRPADAGIVGGRIARVGSLPEARAERVIDASGLVVAPGFIRGVLEGQGASWTTTTMQSNDRRRLPHRFRPR